MRQAHRFVSHTVIAKTVGTKARYTCASPPSKLPAASWRHLHNRLPVKIMGVTSQQEESQLSKTLSQGEVLWEKILQVYRSAEDAGALSKISSSPQDLRDEATNLRFVLQVAENLKDKPKHTSGKKFNNERPPDVFASADKDLTVDKEFTATHMLRLNKFNVVPFHSLTITREFESQQAPLTLQDWEATANCMKAYPEGALAYFNSGEAAGASQPRKHLQILPASLDGQPTAPLTFQETILSAAEQACVKPKEAIPLHQLPFQSFGATLPKQYTASDLHEACSNLLRARPESSRSADFNILAADRHMMLVPRSKESCGPIGCNALVFAGTLLVRSRTELDFTKEHQPMELVKSVTFGWD